MATNIGTLDRILRIVVGLGLIALALGMLPGYAANVWGWLGLVPLGTALVGNCPAYSILGVNTCGRKA